MLLLSFTMIFGVYGMENADYNKFTDKAKIAIPVIINLHRKLLSCLKLEDDIIGHIVPKIFTANSYGTQLQTLALINKQNADLISAIPKEDKALRKFIKNVSDHFQCSNETIAQSLPWKSARQIMFIQNGLFNMCHNPVNVYFKDKPDEVGNERMVEKLCQESDIDLNFTYGKNQITPFMALCASASRCENDEAVRQLHSFFVKWHKRGFVDLNAVNTEGRNGFMISLEDHCTFWVMQSFFLCFLFDEQTLKPYRSGENDIDLIKINHQDNNGDTALHFYFGGDWYPKKEHIKSFIAAGANPEIKNNKGVTPLKQLEQFAPTDENFKNAYEYLQQIMDLKRSHKKRKNKSYRVDDKDI